MHEILVSDRSYIYPLPLQNGALPHAFIVQRSLLENTDSIILAQVLVGNSLILALAACSLFPHNVLMA